LTSGRFEATTRLRTGAVLPPPLRRSTGAGVGAGPGEGGVDDAPVWLAVWLAVWLVSSDAGAVSSTAHASR
ncbi:MAG: hypothetical protein JKY37_28570, partial [Nannocystaceae bacterium]|nr:hypothetical protein [Nannocystaceae bacterium]